MDKHNFVQFKATVEKAKNDLVDQLFELIKSSSETYSDADFIMNNIRQEVVFVNNDILKIILNDVSKKFEQEKGGLPIR